jgi:hypothetical protein
MGPCLWLTLVAAGGPFGPDAPPGPDAEARLDVAAALMVLGARVETDEIFHDRIVYVGYQSKRNIPPEFWRLLKLRPDLEDLDLIDSGVRDEDLGRLAELKNLQTLWLTCTDVSDEGLQRLRDAPRLRRVFCDNTRVTRDGARKLKKAQPRIGVFW